MLTRFLASLETSFPFGTHVLSKCNVTFCTQATYKLSIAAVNPWTFFTLFQYQLLCFQNTCIHGWLGHLGKESYQFLEKFSSIWKNIFYSCSYSIILSYSINSTRCCGHVRLPALIKARFRWWIIWIYLWSLNEELNSIPTSLIKMRYM